MKDTSPPGTVEKTRCRARQARPKAHGTRLHAFALCLAILCGLAGKTDAQGTAFTYQGRLNNAGAPVTGLFDVRAIFYTSDVGGSQAGATVTNTAVAVTNGIFMTQFDPGTSIFTGTPLWLELAVRPAGNGGFTTLSPRQSITPAPYAIYAGNAGTALSAGIAATANNVASNGVSGGALQDNSITPTKIAGGTVVRSLNGQTDNVTLNDWSRGGNTTANGEFLGTVNNQPLELRANNTRALRLEPGGDAPNVIGGSPVNAVDPGTTGAVIAGGGMTNFPNRIWADYSSVGGGSGNFIFPGADHSGISGGNNNIIANNAFESTVGGGQNNMVSGNWGTIPGGLNNSAGSFAFAAGRQARATNTGSFVWADSQAADFTTTTNDQFLIRARNGVGINTTATPESGLNVNGKVRVNDQSIYLRGGTDQNHGLAYAGGGITNFPNASVQPDGPVLWGYGGGALGVIDGGAHAPLTWAKQNVTISGEQQGGFFSPVAMVQNTSTSLFASPALRIVANGRTADGALSVSSQGTGLIARFGNASAFVADITTNGIVEANGFAGNLIGAASTATNFTGTLGGDVTGTQGAAVVSRVGGQTAANVAAGSSAANAATSANTANTIVKRDASGNFSAGAITAGSVGGNGAALTTLNASSLSSGTVADARLSGNIALRNASQTFTAVNTFNGRVDVNNDIGLSNSNLWLRGSGDRNHGLAYAGNGITNFPNASVQPDGPVLWGYGGGALGVINGGPDAVLSWNSGGVNINNGRGLSVSGNLSANNTPGVSWCQGANEIVTVTAGATTSICSQGNYKPAAGFFVLVASATIQIGDDCMYLKLMDVTSTPVELTRTTVCGDPDHASNFYSPSLTWVVPVSAGGGYQNFALFGEGQSGTSTIRTHNLTVMYFPRANN